ncbi:MAG: FAD-dependent oxidoreductase [Halobacteria archaeon]
MKVGVIGGGSVGLSVARDLALRGFDVVLFEKDGLAAGATGNNHGLLHSGSRYAVNDPESARECIRENRVYREIAPNCIKEDGGYFIKFQEDDREYYEKKIQACRDCGIPVASLSTDELPQVLSTEAESGFMVPDAAVDSPRIAAATALDAERHGCSIETDSLVVDVETEDEEVEALVVDDGSGVRRVGVDHVVNCAGAWVDQVGELADVQVPVLPSRGVMVCFDYSLDAVVNRCRPTDDGDILVPHGDLTVAGTTSEDVSDPEEYPMQDWEVERVTREAVEMVPGLEEATVVNTYWGVRPLCVTGSDTDGSGSGDAGSDEPGPREATRGFRIYGSNEYENGLRGFTSVVGGKLTTGRLVAEKTVDAVCRELGVSRSSKTAEEKLPEDDPEVGERMEDWGISTAKWGR